MRYVIKSNTLPIPCLIEGDKIERYFHNHEELDEWFHSFSFILSYFYFLLFFIFILFILIIILFYFHFHSFILFLFSFLFYFHFVYFDYYYFILFSFFLNKRHNQNRENYKERDILFKAFHRAFQMKGEVGLCCNYDTPTQLLNESGEKIAFDFTFLNESLNDTKPSGKILSLDKN